MAKRNNRTIEEMAKSMLHEKGLPKNFWVEAVYTAIYLIKRSPTKVVNDKTPFEAWSRRKPIVKHLKVFGCICYAQVPKEIRYTLEWKKAMEEEINMIEKNKTWEFVDKPNNKEVI